MIILTSEIMLKVREAVAWQFAGQAINGQHANAIMQTLVKELNNADTASNIRETR